MEKLGGTLDAQQNNIINVPAPLNDTSAVNKAYVNAHVGAASSYKHEQNVPDTKWIVEHNLGYNPNVRIANSAGDFVMADIETVDENTLEINFDYANAGVAYCS